MLWRLITLLAGFTFASTGYSVLVDPMCRGITLRGFGSFTLHCNTSGTGESPLFMGWLSLGIGLITILINLGMMYAHLQERRAKVDSAQPHVETLLTQSEIKSNKAGLKDYVQLALVVAIPLGLVGGVTALRESRIHAYANASAGMDRCNEWLQSSSDFDTAYKQATLQKDYQRVDNLLNQFGGTLGDLGNNSHGAMRSALLDSSHAYLQAGKAYAVQNTASWQAANASIEADSKLLFSVCMPK